MHQDLVSECISGVLEVLALAAGASQPFEQVIVSDDIIRGAGEVRGLCHAATLPQPAGVPLGPPAPAGRFRPLDDISRPRRA